MSNYLERIASGKLATANGGGVFSQLYNYDLVVCYTRDDEIYIATKNTRTHEIGGTGATGWFCFPIHGDSDFVAWTETKIFDHGTPTGGDPTATVVAPPVLWVARSGTYLPGVTPNTPACTRNILHLAWAVKFTSGVDTDKYRVYHAMRDKDGVWTCAAGTLASLNAVTDLSATTGQWLNIQMIGLRKWDSTNSRYMSYGTNPTDAETTLYLTYFGRESNGGTDPNNIFLTRFGTSGNNYFGNDWDATQTWLPYASRINASNTAYADELFQQYTLSKASRTVAPTAGPPTVYSHTAQSGTTGHFISIGYTRKGLSKSGGTRTGYYPAYRKYHPDTNTLDSEADVTLGIHSSLASGRDTLLVSTPEQAAYLYDSMILFRPVSGGSSGITDSNISQTVIAPLSTGLLNYYDTNRSRALKDGDSSESKFNTLNVIYFRMLKKAIETQYGCSGTEYCSVYSFTGWQMQWPIQHASCGVSENYSTPTASTTTPPVYYYNTRTGGSGIAIGNDAYVCVFSMNYPGYTGCQNSGGTTVLGRWQVGGVYVPSNYFHPIVGGTRYRFTRKQLFSIADNQYMQSTSPTGSWSTTPFLWPQMGDFDCVNPCIFRAPWFQNGAMPYNMANSFALVFEAYKTDGVDNEVWFVKKGVAGGYTYDNDGPWGFYESTGYYYAEGSLVPMLGDIEREWMNNTASNNGYSSFAGETRRYRVRTAPRQDESSYNRIARPKYALTFNYDVYNYSGLLVDRWNQTSAPEIIHGISQYEATTPIFIGFSVKNQVSSAVRTANVSGFAEIGTVTVSAGSAGETHFDARGKIYTNSILIDTADGVTSYIWFKWTPPGGQPNPPTPQAIDIYLTFAQAT